MTKAQKLTSEWGGFWTERKTSVVRDYVRAYLTALQNQPFKKVYVDAFAGEGYRILERTPGFFFRETFQTISGSPKLVLETSTASKKPFDRFIFFEINSKRADKLLALKGEFPDISKNIEIRVGEANACLLELCSHTDWTKTRALVFLDPYGMQVEWPTMQALASTKAVDLWVLFPLGVSVMRLLKKRGDISERTKQRLSLLFGTDKWYDRFYAVHTDSRRGFFVTGERRGVVRQAGFKEVAEFFMERLKSIFPENGVVSPLFLVNSKNVPIYLLCFACANPKGAAIGTRIASNLISFANASGDRGP